MKTALSTLRQKMLLIAALAGWLAAALGAAEANPAAMQPELFVSVRGVVDDTFEQGDPLKVSVLLEASREGEGPVILAPAGGAWTDAIMIELAPIGGGAAPARAVVVGKPGSSQATLERGRVAGGLWSFPAAAMQRLAPGPYVVRARLAIATGTGWTGSVAAEEIPLQIVAAAQRPERVAARAVTRARAALDANATEEAARILDGVLADNPNAFEALCLRAEVAQRAGNIHAAMVCVNRAATLLGPVADGLPPLDFVELRSGIIAAQLAAPVAAASPPAWSWPPARVLRLDETELSAKLSTAPKPMPGGAPKSPASQNPDTGNAPSVPARVTEPLPVPAAHPASAATVAPNLSGGRPAPAASSTGMLVPAAEIDDARIRGDAAGQWAASAKASSEYRTPRYSAAQATGAPNIALGMAGDNPDAWCPARQNEGTEWLEATFARAVHATEARVLQNHNPGAIAKIEAIEPDGTAHTWWEGVDPYVAPRVRELAWFAVRVPKTPYLVARIKVTLNLAAVPGWKQIDAVQLVAAP